MKKALMGFVAFAMAFCLVSVATAAPKTIGISMPTKSSARWIADGNGMVKEFEKLGYKTDLQYAEDVVENQLAQIENMITKGDSALVVAAIDGESLSSVLQKAADAKIPVIAYDRLIKKTANVDYYATFDNFKVGVIQASQIETALKLKTAKGPLNIELFGGSPDDNNAYFFYNGALSVLQPYIDKKVLVVKSGQMGMDKVSTLRWDGATAQARMDNLLTKNYSKEKVAAVLSPYDGISIGILSSLKAAGLGAFAEVPIFKGLDLGVLPLFAYISLFVTGIGYASYFLAIEASSASTASLVFYIKPALAPLLALAILGESIAPATIAGIALVAVGSTISFLGARKSHS